MTDSTYTFHNLVGGAVSGTFFVLYSSVVSVWLVKGKDLDKWYKLFMISNSFLMCYVFFGLIISDFMTAIDAYSTQKNISKFKVKLSDLGRFKELILSVTFMVLGIIHHTISIIRIVYEIKRDAIYVKNYIFLIAFILTFLYTFLLINLPLIPFILIFFQIDTIPHFIQIILYYQLIYCVKKRPTDLNNIVNNNYNNNNNEIEMENKEEILSKETLASNSNMSNNINDDIYTTFCCTKVYPGSYLPDKLLIKRYTVGITANWCHQISGYIMLGFRALIKDACNPILKYNLDLVSGYIFIALSILYWHKLMQLTPSKFSKKATQ